MEDSLIKESLAWLRITSIVFVVVAIGAVILAFNRSRLLIHPISALIDAGRRLARGDYDAQVNIDTGDELEQLGQVFNQAGPKLREHEKMKRSLELAGAVQQSLLPKQTPSMKNFDIAGQVLYCDETGGDCYDFIDLSHASPGKSGIALGDVSGHGIDAALLMAAVRGSLKAEAMHHGHNLVPLLKQLNQQIIQDTTDDKFVTLFYGILDDASRSLLWTSAGHEPALWLRSEAGHIEELQSTGMPIGVMKDALYEQAGPTSLSPGDVLLVVTDGAREAQNHHGEFFGTERLHQVLRDNAHRSSTEISTAVIQAVVEFQGPAPRTDDITLVVIRAL
jgi:sigma-B regulation protein RsbU (phosphoserine phosphatase)